MIYAEVLEVSDVQTAKIPSKPTITNLLRHSRSEENIIEGEQTNSVSTEDKILSIGSPHFSSNSNSNLPTTNSSADLNSTADCWSQEDDEISLQVCMKL